MQEHQGHLTGKFLYFMEETDGAFDAANDCVAIPVERFKGFTNKSGSSAVDELTMEFDPMIGYSGAHDDATFVADSVSLSINLEISVSDSVGLASLLKYPPGIFPAA